MKFNKRITIIISACRALLGFLLIVSYSNLQANTSSEKPAPSSTDSAQSARPTAASRNSTQIRVLTEQLQKDPKNLKVRKKLARLYKKNKSYKQIIALLRSSTDGLSSPYLLILGKAYRETGKYLEELKILERLTIKFPKKTQYWHLLAKSHLAYSLSLPSEELTLLEKKVHISKSIQSFRECIKLSPKDRLPYEDLLQVFLDTKNYYEGRTLLETMIQLFGSRPKFQKDLCYLYSSGGFLSAGLDYCTKAIETLPTIPENYIYLAQIFADRKNDTKSRQIYLKAAKQFPKSEFVQASVGTYFYKNKDFFSAQKYFGYAIQANQKSAPGQLGWARSNFAISEFKKALDGYVKSCQLDKTSIDYFKDANAILRNKTQDKVLLEDYSLKLHHCQNS